MCESEALAAAHETALGLTETGVLAKRTMKVFDDSSPDAGRGLESLDNCIVYQRHGRFDGRT